MLLQDDLYQAFSVGHSHSRFPLPFPFSLNSTYPAEVAVYDSHRAKHFRVVLSATKKEDALLVNNSTSL